MASILAKGTATAVSDPFTLAEGESATLSLFGAGEMNPSQVADIEQLGSDSGYTLIGQLRGVPGESSQVLAAVGTFRVRRRPTDIAFGVDQN